MKRIIVGTLGGFAGGSVAGLLEGLVISMGGGVEEFGVFFFASVAYGLFGAAMGAGWGFATLILRFLAPELPMVLGGGAGAVLGALGLVVARFRITRDVFAENLPLMSGAGIAVHVGLLVSAAVLFLVGRSLIGRRSEGAEIATGLRWSASSVAAGLVAMLLLNVVAGGADDAEPSAPAGSGPNVLLVIADTLRADHIGPYGAADVNTPALDQLAADGVVFEKAFAHSSWTRPSVATILTSLYAASHSVMHKTDLLPEAVETLAEVFDGEGYRTAGFVTNINVAPSFHFQQGFQKYRYLAPDFFFGATDSGSKLALYGGMRLIRERFLASKKYVANYYQDAETVNAGVVPWLDGDSDRPFFSLVHYMDPHDPYLEIPYNGNAIARVDTPHPDPANKERLRELYISNVEYLDGFLTKLFAGLREAGVYDDTIIAFTADHGEEFYEHEGWWHGTTLYDEQIHVPLIVKLPSNELAGKRVSELVGLVDVAPTVAGMAGASVPSSWQGRDLFAGGKAPAAVYAEEDHEGNILESVRSADWKLILANEGNPRGLAPVELYDLAADPGETNNLADSKPDMVARLTADLEALREVSAMGAVEGETGELDEASVERLRALGYME